MSYVICALYADYEGFVFTNKRKMLVEGQKRKYVRKTLRVKVQVIKDIEKGLSSEEVAAEYNVPENISPWVKNKDKILSPLEEGQNVKWQKLRGAAHETVGQPVFN